MPEPITEARVRQIVREELKAIASQKHSPSFAAPCEKCEEVGNAIMGTVWNGWTKPNKQGKRRIRCRDCYRTWGVNWESDQLSVTKS